MSPDYPIRGQVWEHVRGSRQYRVLIISSDEYNELPGATPWALTIARDRTSVPGYLVRLRDDDPVPSATVVVPEVMRCDPSALRRCLGFVTNNTLNMVESSLREFLDLP